LPAKTVPGRKTVAAFPHETSLLTDIIQSLSGMPFFTPRRQAHPESESMPAPGSGANNGRGNENDYSASRLISSAARLHRKISPDNARNTADMEMVSEM